MAAVLVLASSGFSHAGPRWPAPQRALPTMGLFDGLLGGGLGERQLCNYDNLVGRPDSWGKDAAANALASKVPITSEDGFAIGTFAGGCFWGIELAYQRVPGVICTAVGYCQGKLERPTYNVSAPCFTLPRVSTVPLCDAFTRDAPS